MTSAALNFGVQYLFEFLLAPILDIHPEVELPHHLVILCLSSGGTTIHFYIVTITFAVFNSNAQEALPTLVLFYLFCFIKNGYPNGCGVVSHCGLVDISEGSTYQIPPLFQTSTSFFSLCSMKISFSKMSSKELCRAE